MNRSQINQTCVNTIRFLAVDAVERARSGHPGLPLGAAPMAYVLWDRFLRHNPADPGWFNRDRFILSPGHGSALLYSLLHLYGYDLALEDLRRFRQLGSKTPGHPEYGHTPGVEATTGPLGQGFSMGVGMAMAERFLAAHFNRTGFPVVDHDTYAIVSDGDLMEGVASEAASLAGTLGLGKLVYLYDDNHISIEGDTDIAFRENVAERFEAYGWQVIQVPDGTELDDVDAALQSARAVTERPSLVVVRNHIGFGSPKQDSAAAHGEPLGEEALKATKEALGWPLDPPFHVPDAAKAHFAETGERGQRLQGEWDQMLDVYRAEHPELAKLFEYARRGELPPGWDADIPTFPAGDGSISTRDASGKVMNALAGRHPTFTGGSADLAPSTKTLLIGYGDFGFDDACGHNLHFGIREHAMGAFINGMALHGGVLPYGATFLVFADYLRPALRMSALMSTHVVYVFTHDSIALGEDGPTHQPVEQLAGLRSIPGLVVLRPADANETAASWRLAAERSGPVAVILTRQKLPVLDADGDTGISRVAHGAYIVSEPDGGTPHLAIVATGSEVHLAMAGASKLGDRGIRARVVSMPSVELWREQPEDYREMVLPSQIPKLAVEAAHPMGWREIVGDRGDIIALDRFGASGPGVEVYDTLGFNVANVVKRALVLAGR